jgi:misacylated tRNA(Ala) deacylase
MAITTVWVTPVAVVCVGEVMCFGSVAVAAPQHVRGGGGECKGAGVQGRPSVSVALAIKRMAGVICSGNAMCETAGMTERLFLENSALEQAEAVVIAAGPAGVVLDRTIFYARSGGQPGDVGRMEWDGGALEVADTVKGEGQEILHVAAEGAALPPVGAHVRLTLDWARRHALMRMHTTLHLLCASLPGASVTGGQIGVERSRLDFDLPESPAKDVLEATLNGLIAGNHPVSADWVDESVLDTNPELVRTLSVQPPRGSGRLRLVRIGTAEHLVDLQPCGGTHVASTVEIGVASIVKIENKGRQNRRITVVLN